MFKLFSIMPLDTDNIDAICMDAKNQIDNGIADCILFLMVLVPEGKRLISKAEIACAKYDLFSEKLKKLGVPNGILIQSTIELSKNHSQEDNNFRKYISLVNEKEYEVICPSDSTFKNYMYDLGHTLALHNPAHIMLDDDYRLLSKMGGGCACAEHMKRFNEYANTDLTREELLAIVKTDSKKAKEYTEIFCKTQEESLIEPIKNLRDGIDSVNPTIPGSFCTVGNASESAYEIASVIAGKGNPVTVRINEGYYTCSGGRLLMHAFFRAAAGIAKIKDKVDIILAEPDTCPQNRYSKPASTLHTHFTGTILEGAVGAKHWITRVISYEPQSGLAYRKILAKYKDFYKKLMEIAPQLKWRGFRIPIFSKVVYKLGKEWNQGEDMWNAWCENVFDRLGLPMFFSSENKGVACLEGEVTLSDEEITELLKGTVILASNSAQCLIERGFGEYIGVSVREWQGKTVSREKILLNEKWVQAQVGIKELVPESKEVRVDAIAYNIVADDRKNAEPLFPSTTMYKNSMGGTVYVFAGTPKANFTYFEGFSFLNESRKAQLTNILKDANEAPAYYPNDEEVYMRTADMTDGRLFCAIFNIGMDVIDKLEIVFEKEVKKIEKLMPNGDTCEIAFRKSEGKYELDTCCNIMEPVILFVER